MLLSDAFLTTGRGGEENVTCEICHGIGYINRWSELRGNYSCYCDQCDGTGRIVSVQKLILRLDERIKKLEELAANSNPGATPT